MKIRTLIIINIGIIICIVILWYVSGLIRNLHTPTSYYGEYMYEIQGKTNTSLNYTLFVPVPLDWENKIMFNITDLMIIEGKAAVRYINSTYGLALRIDTRGSFTIRGENWTPRLNQLTLSKDNVRFDNESKAGEVIYYWIYKIDGEEEINISILCKEKKSRSDHPWVYLNGSVSSGWQTISGKFGVPKDGGS